MQTAQITRLQSEGNSPWRRRSQGRKKVSFPGQVVRWDTVPKWKNLGRISAEEENAEGWASLPPSPGHAQHRVCKDSLSRGAQLGHGWGTFSTGFAKTPIPCPHLSVRCCDVRPSWSAPATALALNMTLPFLLL